MKRIIAPLIAFALVLLFAFASLSFLIAPLPGATREEYERQGIAPENNYFVHQDQLVFLGDYYGGKYVDGSKTVVLITEEAGEELVAEFAKRFPSFEVRRTTYSFSYLHDIFSKISDHMMAETAYTIASVGIYTIENRVVVDVVHLTDEIEQHIRKNVVDSPALMFESVNSLPEGGGDDSGEITAPDEWGDVSEPTSNAELP